MQENCTYTFLFFMSHIPHLTLINLLFSQCYVATLCAIPIMVNYD
jgi:hypothetical protein